MRMPTRAMTLGFLLLAAAGVSAQTDAPAYDVLFDIDRNATTGCKASPTGAPAFGGYERRLRATLDTATLTIDTFEVETCNGSVFQPLMSLTGGQPVGLNNGIDGTDVVELAVTTDALNLGNATLIDLAFAADSGAGSDILATQNGAPGGPTILLGLPVSIPTLSAFALMLLATVIVALAWRVHRRAGQLSVVGMVMLVAVVAWAMNFAADGDVADWLGFAPTANDPEGDSTDGNSRTDLRAVFFALENDELFFRIDLIDVENQAPVAVDDAYVTDEDSALDFPAPSVLENDSDENADPITAVLESGPANAENFVLFSSGFFRYVPSANFNGTDSFSYRANDGQADSQVATVTITVNPINDSPLVIDDTASTVEDAPVVISVLDNDSDVDSTLDPTSLIALFPPMHGLVVPDLDTGAFTYTPMSDFSGLDRFTYRVCETRVPPSPGVSCGRADVEILVRPVNDAPSFTRGADLNVLEDAGPQTAAGWATAISAGPPDEAGQVLTFSVTNNSNPGLFSTGPAIDAATGDLTFTTTPDSNGSADITIALSDDGGTVDSGVDTSAPEVFTIGVTAVNDAPDFTVGPDQVVLEDSGQSVVAGFLTDLRAGPPDEAAQSLVTNVVNDNSALFNVQPAIDPSGVLTFTTAADAAGSATITLSVSDDGGTANGGADTAPPAQFVLTLAGVNDAPVLDLDSSDATVGGLDFLTGETCGPAPILLQDPSRLTLSDPDDTTLESVTITLENLLDDGNERLSVAQATVAPDNPNIVASLFDTATTPGQGTLMLTGTDTLANYAAALRTVTYENINATDLTPRTVTFVINDGESDGPPATTTVPVTLLQAQPIGGPVSVPQRLVSPQPPYTQAAIDASIQGNVIVQATIDCRGNVVDVNVLLGLGFGLDESVVDTMLNSWIFEPATLDGLPVSVFFNLTIVFALP